MRGPPSAAAADQRTQPLPLSLTATPRQMQAEMPARLSPLHARVHRRRRQALSGHCSATQLSWTKRAVHRDAAAVTLALKCSAMAASPSKGLSSQQRLQERDEKSDRDGTILPLQAVADARRRFTTDSTTTDETGQAATHAPASATSSFSSCRRLAVAAAVAAPA